MLYESPKIKYFRDWLGERGQCCSDGSLKISASGILAAVQSAYTDIGLLPSHDNNIGVALLDLAEKGEIEKLVYYAIVNSNRTYLRNALGEWERKLEEGAA